jgi:hypothetical protein
MKINHVRLIALLNAIIAIVIMVGDCLHKTREPLAGMIFAQVCVVLMIVAAMTERIEKRVAKLENETNVSENNDV